MNKFTKQLIYGVFPKSCAICDSVIEKEKLVCDECIKKIKFVKEPKCKKCGKQLINERDEYCGDCNKNHHLFVEGVSAFEYTEEIRRAIYKFKYHNRRDYGSFFAWAIYENNKRKIEGWNPDVIVPVPIYQKRRLQRGYNQAEILAEELSEYVKIPADMRCIIRQTDTKPQKDLTAAERKRNLENAFKIVDNVVKYKKVMLVDDIYTTGSTVDACAKVLLSAGVREVYCASLSVGTGI